MLGDQAKRAKLFKIARECLRNFVPLTDIQANANAEVFQTEKIGNLGSPNTNAMRTSQSELAERFNLTSSKSWVTGRFNEARLNAMLHDAGVCVDASDVSVIFYEIDCNLDGYIEREEFIDFFSLTEYETDEVLEKMKSLLMPKSKDGNILRSNRTLSDIFSMSNSLKDGVLSFEDMAVMFGRLEIFLDENEIRRVMKKMHGEDDRVEEKDFISFVKKTNQINILRAHRLRDVCHQLKGWIKRNSNDGL